MSATGISEKGIVVDDVEQLARLVDRARALIENAGDGDWNRESAEWQLAAAQWRRDAAALGVKPNRFVLENDLSLADAVTRAVGAASPCWTELSAAGVFDAEQAQQIAAELISWIRAHPTQVVPPFVAGPGVAGGDYRDDPVQTAGHVWQEELDQEQVAASLARTGFPEGTFRGTVREAAECPACGFKGQWLVDGKDGVLLAEVCPSCRHRYEVPQQEAQEPQETRAGLDLGADPDGDVEGYDGPLVRPGGYCHGSEPWHPYGTVVGCCTFGGVRPAPGAGPVQSRWPEEHQTP